MVARFGPDLPYLLKVIAAERPLSLQVHPNLEQARAGFAAEEAAGIASDAAERSYRDPNHKPELVVALSAVRGGVRVPLAAPGRRGARRSRRQPHAVARRRSCAPTPSAAGMRAVFRRLLDPRTRPEPALVDEVARACEARLEVGSPSPRADRNAVRVAEAFPGDPGVVVSLLLNPVTLQPGEAMFVPPGGVHAYLEGDALEIMASSDNVLRAGLTRKHVDVLGLLDIVDCVAAPPVRIAPESFGDATKVYYAPVDDFELSVATLSGGPAVPLPGRGPRVLLCLEGEVTVASATQRVTLRRGGSTFVSADEGPLRLVGEGTLAQADVP